MRVLTAQEFAARKAGRQAGLAGLTFHAMGHCAHLGRISPGCFACFAPVPCWGVRLGQDAGLPDVCNCDCVHCFGRRTVQDMYAPPADWSLPVATRDGILRHFLSFTHVDPAFALYTFSGTAEPLFYLPVIRAYMTYLREVVDVGVLGFSGWAKVYTNGILLNERAVDELAAMGVQEVRVNPSASGFSDQVYRNIENAARVLPTVSVEVPAWPPYREGLFAMLPVLQSIGVRHLNICQVEIMTADALRRVAAALPRGEVSQSHWMMLDDCGLVEDIIREVTAKEYRYSVMDCSGLVKQVYANTCFKQLGRELGVMPAFGELCNTERCPARPAAVPVWRQVPPLPASPLSIGPQEGTS